ncbi:MAG: glutamate racemase [Firmicutes bacterium]|nr:glutamate racemase [Bacillota bacterium]
MDGRPIGFFDSGIGGVTSIPHILRMLPEESVIFFGDTARTPYGSKSPHTIRQFTLQIGDFLVRSGVKMIVIACNTVSSTALDLLRETYPQIPVIGCIAPTARELVKDCPEDAHVGILATRATIRSGAYEKKIHELKPELKLFPLACPALVPLIEEGLADTEIMDLTLKHYLDPFMDENQIDTLVLGCTHYPLVSANLKRLYPGVRLLSSSHEVATAVNMELKARNMLAAKRERENTFYASDLSSNFVDLIEKILGRDKEELDIRFKNLDI